MHKQSLIEKIRDKDLDTDHNDHIAQITGVQQVPTPVYYRHIETGQEFYDISGALVWPTADSAGFAVIVGVKKGDDPQGPAFEALAEVESPSVEGLLKACCEIRGKWGFTEVLDIWMSLFLLTMGRHIPKIKSNNRIEKEGSMPKRRYDPDAARQDILDAAENLFAAHGFGDVSTSRIAKAAKVSQSQIHYHFESKRNLWMAVFERRFAEYFEAQSHMLASTEYEGLERMRASMRAYFDFFRRNPRFVKLLGRAQIEAAVEDKDHGNMSSDLMQRGTEVIAEAQRQGSLRGDVLPEFIMIGFLSMVAYWFQCRERYLPEAGLTGEPERYDDRYLDFIQKVYLKGIAP